MHGLIMILHHFPGALGLLAVLVLVATGPLEAQREKELLDLRGTWKFALGDDAQRASASFNDANWSSVHVPGYWEDEGYPGYNGYAWYRTRFHVPGEWSGKTLYLELGRIDDVDRVFVNGKPLGGRGAFPPAYRTAYGDTRRYPLSPSLLVFGGENVLSVRVYDAEMGGGIVGKEVHIVEDLAAMVPDEPLSGTWRFATGDDLSWRSPTYDDAKWKEILVPSYWESQGYENYDGYAWYRIRFRVRNWTAGRDMVLLLGKIDDVDEVYLNGEFLGRTGKMLMPGEKGSYGDNYKKLRAYTVPQGKLYAERENLIAVKVSDNWRDGGIYDGPIGLVTPEHYRDWTNHQNKRRPFWEVFEELFK